MALPAELGEMKSLTKLNVESNKLQTFPPEICELENLRHLKAKSNELHELPEEIGGLVALQKYFISFPSSLFCPTF
jgi:leucine-rich repeat protein SHOC2